ncbi:MAG: DUF3327 domain-containing protein [Candidatus Azobacteroides sp.]|nr:DUF3327 domain-containing protein [Candidatus Azobacteroides sp.]
MSVSPTIEEMQRLPAGQLKDKVEEFWLKIQTEGLPLIEPDPLYEHYEYVTFIYRNEKKYPEVKLFIPGIYDEYRFGDKKMYQLGNTDLYYRTYLLAKDVCLSYRFDVKNRAGKVIKELDPYNKNRIPKQEARSYSYSVLDRSNTGQDWGERMHPDLESKIDSFTFESHLLKNKREIYIYLPPGYDFHREEKYPVIYLFDAFVYLNRVEVPVVLDNLIAENKIPPMVAVMLDNPTNDSRYVEYPLNFDFKHAIVTELIPFIREKYNVSLSPEKNIIGGMSYGGLAAAFFAFYHPDIFGNVLSQSGSFWRDKILKDKAGNEYRNDWLPRQFLLEEKKEIKIFLDWGLQENMVLGANRNFVRVLEKKKYDYAFMELNGWHNWSITRRTFPLGVMFLLNRTN